MRRLINRIQRALVRNKLINISQQLADLPKTAAREQSRIDARHATDTADLENQQAEWSRYMAAEQKRLALRLAALGDEARKINHSTTPMIEAQS